MIAAGLARKLASTLFALVVLVAAGASALAAPKVATIAFGLYGDQGVFRSEASGAASIVARRYGRGGPVVVRYNNKNGGTATADTLAATLRSVSARIDRQSDVLILILTSHGSPDGIAVKAGNREQLLSPAALAAMLDATGVRYKVVIISACYAGVFIGPLANADTLVITAADAYHSSFGCEDEARWTYFGDAFFNVALRREKSFTQAFILSRSLIQRRESQQGFTPSNPQIAGGANVEPLLVPR
jgi:hypothetical protein